MLRRTSTPVFLICLILSVCLNPLAAQTTTGQSDKGNALQVVLVEQMISLMETMNDHQMALMEQIHSTSRSVDRQMEESKYVGDRQMALLRSIERLMEEANK
ncbi:hypothetical protein LSAT2_028746, partial [Lamellibrachia satsuma]